MICNSACLLHGRLFQVNSRTTEQGTKNSPLELDSFLRAHDFVGATCLLEFEWHAKESRPLAQEWMAYCAYHNGDYNKANSIYDALIEEATKRSTDDGDNIKTGFVNSRKFSLYKACCLYAMYMYKEAEEELQKAGEQKTDVLGVRLMFQIEHKLGNQNSTALLNELQESSSSSKENQLCLAAMRYLQMQYQEAIDIYKKLLVQDPSLLAVNVYIAMCYYKLDYYDVALELVQAYTKLHPYSAIATNLKACCQCQLFDGKSAEAELKGLQDAATSGNILADHDILRHNLLVFRNGENALQVLSPLTDIVPEARMNLIIHYLRNDDVSEAFNLAKDLEPSAPREYILKGVVLTAFGQKTDSQEHLTSAQKLFQFVGTSASECDTIPGRQSMASCFFLLKQFDDVLVYLRSIRDYFTSDDDFNWNYGIACAATGEYKNGRDALILIQNERYRADLCFVSWLCRCYVMCGEPNLAWETYLRMDTSNESFTLLQLIANDCYRTGLFYWACKAFDILERLDPDPEFWEGKRGAAVGVFQKVIAGRESVEKLQGVVNILRSNSNPQVEYMINMVIKKWAKENRVNIE
eukprot:GHVQ01017367.1.p1 GENE.GHVQ01017367.1~~GHVQ01017367.1.p1  ORF type:complete len:581 (+),score=50.03 GHVQ01017367.1:68-1810(+)